MWKSRLLSTREVYLKQRINALTNEIKNLKNTVRVSHETQASLEVLSRRVDPLYEIFQELAEGMKVWANKLRDQALFEQSNSLDACRSDRRRARGRPEIQRGTG